jgi:hypothetical protein
LYTKSKQTGFLPEIAKIFDDSIISGSLVTPKTAGIESICGTQVLIPTLGGYKIENKVHEIAREGTYSESNITQLNHCQSQE